jgi:hypothetical protein
MNTFNSGSALDVTLISHAILLFIGVPIGFVLSADSKLYLFASHTVSTTAVPLSMQNSMMNFILLAIPFFVIEGLVMTSGGLSQRLIHFIVSLIGRVREGLYHVIIIATYIIDTFPFIPGYFPWDLTLFPMTMMSMIQIKPKWNPFYKGLLLVLFYSICEPLAYLSKFYEPINWKFYYSFPIYII